MKTTVLNRNRPGIRARTGFTFVETLVALSCVGLLYTMVVPSLEAARQRSKQSTCLERLRQIGDASAVYRADDPSDFTIPVHPLLYSQQEFPFIGAYEWGGKSGIGTPGAVPGPGGEDAFLTSRYGTLAGFGSATRPLNEIIYPHGFRANSAADFDRAAATADTMVDLTAYRCPADDGPPSGAHCIDWVQNADRSSFDHFGTSYAANTFMTAYSFGGLMRSNSPYLRPASRVPVPARTIHYEENIGRWAWACRREYCDFIQPGVDPGPTKAVRGWHGKNWTYSRAFGDAHAESQRVFIEGTEDSEGYSVHYISEIVFDDRDLQTRYRCLIVRGDGWQKDTLPDEFVDTGLNWGGGGGRPSDAGCANAWRN